MARDAVAGPSLSERGAGRPTALSELRQLQMLVSFARRGAE